VRSDGQPDRDGVVSHCSPEAPPIRATSDVHSPRYLGLFKAALEADEPRCARLILLAGDMVDRGSVEALAPVLELINGRYPGVPVAAVFGNEEYHDREELFRRRYPTVAWLDDEYRVFDVEGASVAVVGTRGALARPTRWQRRNMPWLARVYRERPRLVAELIRRARSEADKVILLSHYALARATIEGEPPSIWPELYSPEMERVIAREKPDAAVHGHAHRGKPQASVAGVPVYNVALPLNKRIVAVRPRRGLGEWLAGARDKAY